MHAWATDMLSACGGVCVLSMRSMRCGQVRMGFAHRNPDGAEGLAYVGADCQLKTGGYTCPRCSCFPAKAREGMRRVDIPYSLFGQMNSRRCLRCCCPPHK